MIKTSLGFLAGVLVMAAVVYVAGARFAAPMFVAGVCAVLVPSIALLASVDRMRAFARFLTAFADALGSKQRPVVARVPVSMDRSGYRKPSTKQQSQILSDTIDEYLPDDMFTAPSTRRAS